MNSETQAVRPTKTSLAKAFVDSRENKCQACCLQAAQLRSVLHRIGAQPALPQDNLPDYDSVQLQSCSFKALADTCGGPAKPPPPPK